MKTWSILEISIHFSLNLGFHVGDNPKVILKNREKLALVLGIPLSNFTTAKQTHDCNVEIVTEGLRGSGTLNYDTARLIVSLFCSSI